MGNLQYTKHVVAVCIGVSLLLMSCGNNPNADSEERGLLLEISSKNA